MNNFLKTLGVTLLFVFIPFWHYGQPIADVQNKPTIEFNITDISIFEERIFFLYHLANDSRFDVITGETDGYFVISANEAFEGLNLGEAFTDFREQNALAFSRLDKVQAAELTNEYKAALPNDFALSLMMDLYIRSRQNNTCANADPFCTDNGMYQFPAGVNAGSGESGPYYDCLYTTPNPAWYYMQIDNPGNIDIYMYSTPSVDIDFCCWGPYSTITNPSPCSSLTANKVVSCSYSINPTEHCLIPSSAQTGDYFILVITNYSNQSCNISFSKVAGTGTTNCGILPPLVNNDGPYCVGETIYLSANGQAGSTYSWTGPGSFSSNQQNPTRPNCTMAMAGTYTCTIAVGSQTNSATTEVVVNPQPVANFNFTTTCQGGTAQFTSTSTTNPTGHPISSYQWNFGDGQTGTGQSTTHVYSQAGNYNVTLIVETANGACTDQITKSVSVTPLPTASFNFTTVCQGNVTQFTSTSTAPPGQQINSFQWNFGDGQTGLGQTVNHTYAQAGTYNVTLTVATSDVACTNQITQAVPVNALPSSNFNFTTVCRGEPTQFTSTATAPLGQHITSYQWNFGDGQTGSGQTVSHTYAQAGTYNVTHTVSTTGGTCADDITQAVPVNALPVPTVSANPNTVMYGGTTTLTANAGTQGSFNFHWEPADKVVSPNSQTTQTIPLYENQVFICTVTNSQGNCSGNAQLTVSIEGSNMAAQATADQNDLCEGESTTLHAQPSGGTGNYTFEWTPANTLNNPNIQNPVATPPLGTTTYTCHVSDGLSDQNVSVSIHVHPNTEADINATICPDETYDFFGELLSDAGTYDHIVPTSFGCDSTIHLHLSLHEEYETLITDRFCQGHTYEFYGETIENEGIYYHTLETVHGCDSVIKLNLAQDPSYEVHLTESTCEGGPGYYFAPMNIYLPPSPEPNIFVFESVLGCDSIVVLTVEESEYNTKTYNVSICNTEFTWSSNGQTYVESGTYYDTIQFPNSCDSLVILNLELRPSYEIEERVTSCDTYNWKNDVYGVDMTFDHSTTYTHHYINEFGCQSEVTLYLEINDHDVFSFEVPEEESCDSYEWNPQGHEFTELGHTGNEYNISGYYERIYKNIADCDSVVTMHVDLEYRPSPTPIFPMDANNEVPHWVITATEFQINAYDFNLWDSIPVCKWDSVTWTCEGAPHWVLEPFGENNKCCKLYVLNYIEDTVWLKARIFNRCAPEGVVQKYWLVCSFYGLDEQEESLANFTVMPNPNNGQMTLNFEYLTGKVDIKVYDMRGILIDNFQTFNDIGPNSLQYDMKRRAEGIYFFVATGKEGTIAKKVVIRR